MSSSPTDLNGFRCVMALKMSDSEISDMDRDSENDDEMDGKNPGEGL
jgi:hypothetical protein